MINATFTRTNHDLAAEKISTPAKINPRPGWFDLTMPPRAAKDQSCSHSQLFKGPPPGMAPPGMISANANTCGLRGDLGFRFKASEICKSCAKAVPPGRRGTLHAREKNPPARSGLGGVPCLEARDRGVIDVIGQRDRAQRLTEATRFRASRA
jgi:hypothetical protein